MTRRKILIDLDGVLNEYTKGCFDKNYIPNPREGVEDFLIELNKDYDLYLFTSRNLLLASKWLINNNLDSYFKDVTNIKLPAYLFIDDRNIKFNGNYSKTLTEIKHFKVNWE